MYMKNNILVFLLVCLCGCQQTNSQSKGTTIPGVRIREIVTGLNSPVALAAPDDGSERLFIAEQGGIIKVIVGTTTLATPLLDLRPKMISLNRFYDERGLLGLVCHPDFKTNGKFYVYYSAASSQKGMNHKSVLEEYQVNPSDKNVANGASAKRILEIEEPESNHNGGQLAFGPDGYLYIAVGDGGGAGDKHGNAGNGQNLFTLLGKILRIDVSSIPYKIPVDNPFKASEAKPEIWAYGLRNPWRFSFDRKTGQLFCADVGQDEYEEVNIIEKGKNYGWRIMEASHCFNPAPNCNKQGLTLPIDEYSHAVGQSVTGGYVYRGSVITEFTGKYVFADWTGPMFYLSQDSRGKWNRSALDVVNKPEDLRVLSFGEDAKGELYILTSQEVTPKSHTGALYKIIPR
jgi:glucose/arabinose dehydrogenase